MAEPYSPSLVYTDQKSMRVQDRYLNFALVRAPIAEVTAAIGGIMRASENGATVTVGATTPPIILATRPRGYISQRRGVLVSRPTGADIVLVEFNHLHNVLTPLSMMLPEVEVVGFRSNWETRHRWYNELSVHFGGEMVRQVDLDEGMRRSGLSFVELGDPRSFETPDSYTLINKSQRLTRRQLLDAARRCWLDVDRALYGRELSATTYFEGVDSLLEDTSAVHAANRTTDFQEEHDRAVALGIGEGETNAEEVLAQEAYLERIEALTRFSNRFGQAMQRALPDAAKTKKAYDKWMGKPERPGGFDPAIPLGWIVEGIDRSGPEDVLSFFDEEHALWCEHRELSFRLTQTVVDQIDGVTEDLSKLDLVVPNAVAALKAGRYADTESTVRGTFAAVCRDIGIRFDKRAPVLTREAAERSAARELVKGQKDLAHQINSDLTVFHIAPPNGQD